MIVLPAIDLMNGEVVRLEQGKAERKTVYSSDPVAFAKQWAADGARFLHLVDLDAAFSGTQQNLPAVRDICSAIDIPCELGGGIRDMSSLAAAFGAGIQRAIIGSRACESLDFIKEAVREFGGDKIAVGIDAKDGMVATQGWVKISSWRALDLAKAVGDLGVGNIIYTDISTDGMFTGPNLAAQREMLAALNGVKLTASGGVSSLADIGALAKIDRLYGVIVGKALYDGKLQLREALALTGA